MTFTITADLPSVAIERPFSMDSSKQEFSRSSEYDISRVVLTELQFGDTRYPLRHKLRGTYMRYSEELFFEGVSGFVGKGSTQQKAVEDFICNIHKRFQELVHKLPSELNETESKEWMILSELVDVTVYRNVTPITVRQLGEIRYGMRAIPCKVKWDNGFEEDIDPQIVDSPEFITFRSGQPIEALVVRNPLTREIQRIKDIRRISKMNRSKKLDKDQMIDMYGSTAELEEADWE